MTTAKKRRSWSDRWSTDPHLTNRELFVRDPDSPLKIRVRNNGTVIVDVEKLYRVVEHTGEFDEETGLERIAIVDELQTFKEAHQTTQIRNHGRRGKCSRWLEILDYDEVYKRENGKLIDHVRPRKTGANAKRLRAANKKLRIAKVG